MNPHDHWDNWLSDALWVLPRVTRDNTPHSSDEAIDTALIRRCAHQQQGLYVTGCDAERAAELLFDCTERIDAGLIWVVTPDDEAYRTIRQKAEALLNGGSEAGKRLVYDVHPLYRNADDWQDSGIRLLLNTAGQLRDHNTGNPRRRKDVLGQFCPLLALVDPDLAFCRKWSGFDPAWVLRDLASRLCVPDRQGAVALAVFTTVDPITVLPSALRRTFGIEGFVYLTASLPA